MVLVSVFGFGRRGVLMWVLSGLSSCSWSAYGDWGGLKFGGRL